MQTCANCLHVYGSRKDRELFWNDVITDKEFNLNAIIPLKDTSYAYKLSFWGTSRDCFETSAIRKAMLCDKILFKTMDTPYSLDVHKEMNERYPQLAFKLLYIYANTQGYYNSNYWDEKPIETRVKFKNGKCFHFIPDKEYDELYSILDPHNHQSLDTEANK
jgi:hypothetical protein